MLYGTNDVTIKEMQSSVKNSYNNLTNDQLFALCKNKDNDVINNINVNRITQRMLIKSLNNNVPLTFDPSKITIRCIKCNEVIPNFVFHPYIKNKNIACRRHMIMKIKKLLEKTNNICGIGSKIKKIKVTNKIYKLMLANIHFLINHYSYVVTVLLKIIELNKTVDNDTYIKKRLEKMRLLFRCVTYQYLKKLQDKPEQYKKLFNDVNGLAEYVDKEKLSNNYLKVEELNIKLSVIEHVDKLINIIDPDTNTVEVAKDLVVITENLNQLYYKIYVNDSSIIDIKEVYLKLLTLKESFGKSPSVSHNNIMCTMLDTILLCLSKDDVLDKYNKDGSGLVMASSLLGNW